MYNYSVVVPRQLATRPRRLVFLLVSYMPLAQLGCARPQPRLSHGGEAPARHIPPPSLRTSTPRSRRRAETRPVEPHTSKAPALSRYEQRCSTAAVRATTSTARTRLESETTTCASSTARSTAMG